jgi:subtilase family serine protease
LARRSKPAVRLRALALTLLVAAGVLAAAPVPLALPNLPPSYDTQTLIASPAPSTPTLDGVVDAVWSSARPLEITAFGASGAWPVGAGISMRAMHDNTTLFLLIQWDDATQDYSRDAWLLSDNQTASGNWTRTTWGDDAMAFYLANASAGDVNFTSAGCGPTCHTGGTYNEMRTTTGLLDAWLWSSSLTAPLGFADDRYLDNASKPSSPTGGLHGDGADPFADNSVVTGNGTRPGFLNGSVPLTQSAKFIAAADASPINWLSFNSTSMPKGATVPGYILSAPTGGRADVAAGAAYASSKWTLEMSRPLVTADLATRDVQVVDLNETYFFNLAVFNNQTGINHSNAGFVYKLIFAGNSLSDLTPESVTPDTPTTTIGNPVNITVSVRNQGFGPSSSSVFASVVDNVSLLQVANGSVPSIASFDFYLLNLSFSSVGYTPGPHNFTVSVDTVNTEAESFENNNTRPFQIVFVNLVTPSDLSLETADGPALTVFDGETFIVNGSVRNIGPGDTLANVTVDGGHPLFGNRTQDIGPLAAGASANYSLVFNASSVPRGTYAISVKVDPANLISEQREDNNGLVALVDIEDRSDLTVPAVFADPASGTDGATLNLTVTVLNRGAHFAGAIEIWIYYDDAFSTTGINRTALWNVSVDLLHAGRANFSAPWTIPAARGEGNHSVRARVDAADAVVEFDENNNNGYAQIFVVPPPRPDLEITAIATAASAYTAGDTATVSITVLNRGVNYTGSVRMSVTEATLNRPLGNITVLALAANASAVYSLDFIVPPGTPGAHSVLAEVDIDHVLDEVRELNNVRSTAFTLLAPPVPELQFASTSHLPALPTLGEGVTISAVVRNAGDATSSAGTSLTLMWGSAAIGTVAVPAIAPGASFTGTFLWDTTNVTSLSALLTATVTVPPGAPEANQSNNVVTFSVNFLARGQSEIHIANITVTPAAALTGDPVRVEARVFNIGTGEGSVLVVFLVGDRPFEFQNVTLAPGESQTVRATWNSTGVGSVALVVQIRTGTPAQTAGQVSASVTLTAPAGSSLLAWVALGLLAVVGIALFVFLRKRAPREPRPEVGKEANATGQDSEPAARPDEHE